MSRLISTMLLAGVLLTSPVASSQSYDSYPQRSVFVNDEENNIICSRPNEENKIALTFDDGPHYKLTGEILDILLEYDIQVTFYVIGVNVEAQPDLVRRMVKEGHEVANHTYDHRHMSRKSTSEIVTQLKRTEEILAKFDITPTTFRPPEGIINERMKAAAREAGYPIILWSLDTRDWLMPSASSIVNYVTNNIKSGDIVLFHDFITPRSPTPDALREILPLLIDRGFEFVTVEELVAL